MKKETNKDLIGKGYHILVKPIGPLCNLDCSYCFYSEKKAFFPKQNDFSISNEVLEAFIKKYIASQEIPEIQFVWQGGEPTLLGLDFYKNVVSLQKKYAMNKKIVNSLQTNGTLLNEEWCVFLKSNGFLVGLSLDGPAAFHDAYRLDHRGGSTHSKVINALSILKKHDIPFNVLVCVTRESSVRPIEVYRFLKEHGAKYIQFTPIVERIPDNDAAELGLRHALPPDLSREQNNLTVSPATVEPEAYGDFLIQVFEEWVRNDVGKIFIMNFEWALEAWLGLPSTICIFSEECGKTLTMEHNGDIYSCDHYVYPEYRLGNILTDNLNNIVDLEKQRKFGREKEAALPRKCSDCEAAFACRGECPRHRFIGSDEGEPGLNYLCAGYKKYFRHIHRYMKVMATLIENDLPASNVMDAIKGPIVMINKKH
jgi:uncharacterized protein